MTYLYIKIHNKTGLKYFGQTKHDPYRYSGSGKYWKLHLKKHGNDVTTYILSYDGDVTEAALKFSKENNIVESKEWANLREEDGVWGSPIGANAGKNNGMFGKPGPNLGKRMVGVGESNKKRCKPVTAFGILYKDTTTARIACQENGISQNLFWKKLRDENDTEIIPTQPRQ